jgi:hypothetical protein
MKRFSVTYITFLILLLVGCGGAQPSGGTCSNTKSIIKTEAINFSGVVDSNSGILLTTHLNQDIAKIRDTMASDEVQKQCNVAIELLQQQPPKLRLWTASHCIKPLLVTSLTLALRDNASSSGFYYKWKLDHEVLAKGKAMRKAYDLLAGGSLIAERERLYKSFDRRNMLVEGSSAVLSPRVSCENLRWSQDADNRHSLCFSIFDLIYLDVDLPEAESEKSKTLVSALANSPKSAATESRLTEQRTTFMRRMNITSQSEWIIHDGNRVRQFMSSFARNVFPFFSDDVLVIETLNREVFSLPHPEESSFMTPETVVGQDAIPPTPNTSWQAINLGAYKSPRVDISNVNVTCHRQLRKYNPDTGVVDTLPILENRPHEYCPGGAKFSPDHFWNRDRPWSHMMADMTVDAAQKYSKAIYDAAMESVDKKQRLARFNLVSSFGISEDLGFGNVLSDLTTPLLKHLRIPLATVTNELFGFDTFEQTGALLFSLPINETQARFLKGDSGSIVMLDGVPIATLYSVDGEETSGGSSILALPDATSEEGSSTGGGTQTTFNRGNAPVASCK